MLLLYTEGIKRINMDVTLILLVVLCASTVQTSSIQPSFMNKTGRIVQMLTFHWTLTPSNSSETWKSFVITQYGEKSVELFKDASRATVEATWELIPTPRSAAGGIPTEIVLTIPPLFEIDVYGMYNVKVEFGDVNTGETTSTVEAAFDVQRDQEGHDYVGPVRKSPTARLANANSIVGYFLGFGVSFAVISLLVITLLVLRRRYKSKEEMKQMERKISSQI